MSLARKCLLLFGGVVALVVLAAMGLPWFRMNSLIDEGQLDVSRQMVATWESLAPEPSAEVGVGVGPPAPWIVSQLLRPTPGREVRAGIEARELSAAQAREDSGESAEFVREAIEAFTRNPSLLDYQRARWAAGEREYRYAKAIIAPDPAGSRVVGLIELQRRSVSATRSMLINTIYLLAAGAAVFLTAMLVFWILTHKLVLSPVNTLRLTAERVREGNLAIRSELRTGDEFEQLSDTFNSMLTDLQSGQDRLRSINTALDMKLHELTQANTALHQAAKIKGEFLASVSHELRTPLNSINGFAELLLDIARAEAERPDPPHDVARRTRYLENILTAGRGLLGLINSLLEMARIEAGKTDLRVEQVNIRDVCEGLLGLIAPVAAKKSIELKLEAADDLPNVATDVRKFQQVVFNFLSNAVKFSIPPDKSGRAPQITLRAERLAPSGTDGHAGVRVSVIDNGPGIPKDEQEHIFEKFYQAGGGVAREQGGTGLGLAISKDLAALLKGEIQVVSDVGHGSMFSLIIPVTLDGESAEAGRPAAPEKVTA